LNGARVKKFGAFFRNRYSLRDKIHIVGKVGQLRKLAKEGTIVMVPTISATLIRFSSVGSFIHSDYQPLYMEQD
jgi:glycerol-3-phosphate O-acyltransferase